MDKNFIKEVIRSMQGVFLPKEQSQSALIKDINDSLRNLEFYGPANDRKNMKGDTFSLNRDINKAVKEAKVKFGPVL